jgi:large subunit ribosomal protein L25
MSDKIVFEVSKREVFGSKVKKLRQQGLIVANIYGNGDSIAVQAPARPTIKLYQEVGESTVVYLKIDGGKEKAVLFDRVETHPISNEPIHISFRAVNLKEKIRTMVEIFTIGELAAKNAVALLTHQEVEVEALPTDLPEGFEIDLSKFENIGDEVKFADLDYDKSKVELLVEDLDAPVLVVNEVEEEVEEETPEATAETPAAEAAAPAEAAKSE